MWAPFEQPAAEGAPPAPAPDATDRPEPEVDLVWRCNACGYQRLGASAPDRCAGCGAAGSQMVGRTAIEWRFLLRRGRSLRTVRRR